MKKFTVKTNRGEIELTPERILANNVIFPREYNPHNVRLWVIGNEYGPLCAVWSDCEQDALDEACDKGLLDSFLVSKKDFTAMNEVEREELAHLGNAGESADLTYAWIEPVDLSQQPLPLLLAFAEARGANADSLDR